MNNVIDLARPIVLSTKYSKYLANGRLLSIELKFTALGQECVASYEEVIDGIATVRTKPISQALLATRGHNSAKEDFKKILDYEISHYEKRIGEDAPKSFKDSTTEEMLEAAKADLILVKRQALSLSNKEYNQRYLRWENGNPIIKTPDMLQAEKLAEIQLLTAKAAIKPKGSTSVRGRGRGRGSFRAPSAPEED